MSSDQKHFKMKRLEALIHDKQHLRRNALRLAGMSLQGAKKDIIESEVSLLDEEVREDEELCAAYEALIEAIAQEVVKIGEKLVEQAKHLQQ